MWSTSCELRSFHHEGEGGQGRRRPPQHIHFVHSKRVAWSGSYCSIISIRSSEYVCCPRLRERTSFRTSSDTESVVLSTISSHDLYTVYNSSFGDSAPLTLQNRIIGVLAGCESMFSASSVHTLPLAREPSSFASEESLSAQRVL